MSDITITSGRDSARKLLGKGSDLVEMADGKMRDPEKASYDKGQYRNFKDGGTVKKIQKMDEAQDARIKGALKKHMEKGKKAHPDADAKKVMGLKKGGKAKKCYADGGKVGQKSKIIGDNTTQLTGQEVTENQTALMKAKGGKVKKFALGGAGKVRKGQATTSGKPINKKR